MLLPSDFTKLFPSCVETFLNKTLLLAEVSICIRFWVRLLVILTAVSLNFVLLLNTLFLMLYLTNLMIIGLDWLPFLIFLIQLLWSISKSVSFSCKRSFKVYVIARLLLHSHFPLDHAPKAVSTRVFLMRVNHSN